MRELMEYVDVGITNEEDWQKSLDISVEVGAESAELDTAKHEALSSKVHEIYPEMSTIAITPREGFSTDRNCWSACLSTRDHGFTLSRRFEWLTSSTVSAGVMLRLGADLRP